MKETLILLLLLSILNPVRGINGIPKEPETSSVIKPMKLTAPPVIDGILDEEIWKSNEGISGFKTFVPDYGKDMPFKTTVWVAYDEENLYYAFRCDDPEPDKIKTSVDARDRIRQDDWVCVNLDSYNDQQTLYCIYSNANGIQMDTRYAAGNEDLGMDLVFYSAGKIDDNGYCVEIRLPLKSIRFSNREPVMMAATFERHISRLSTQGTFPPLAADQGMAFLTQMQQIRYDGVKHYKLFEAIPAVTYSYRAVSQEGEMTTSENRPDAGLTLKYGITSQLVLDATINPDFSQVEADAGQVDANLRYQLYFPEKRPFFQEGNENFMVGATGTSSLDPITSFVHTRNIADPIAGVKLSGKAGLKNSISVLYAADRIPAPDNETYGSYSHFPIIRYKRSLRNDSYIGFLGTSVLRGNSSNYNFGTDGNIRLNKSTLLDFHAFASETNDTASGINNRSGHAIGFNLHSEQRNIDYGITAQDISEYFISQAGFINRTGVTILTGKITPKLYTDSKIFRRFDFELFTGHLRDNIYDLWETYNSLTVTSLLGGTVRTNLKMIYSTEVYLNERFNTGGVQAIVTGRIGTRINGAIVYRRRASVIYADPSQGYGNSVMGEIRYLPTEKIHTQVSVTFQDLYNQSDRSKEFDYLLLRGRVTYQVNKYLFFRIIGEYNDYRESLTTDFLASFTYIPGTVIHIGYGSLYEHKSWDGNEYVDSDSLLEMKRGFFMKLSYLFRL